MPLPSDKHITYDSNLESRAIEFNKRASLIGLNSLLQNREITAYSQHALCNEINNAINVNYSSQYTTDKKIVRYVDSLLIPIQGDTFNINAAAYCLDYVKFIIRNRFVELDESNSKLNYILLRPGEVTVGGQKFYLTTTFGIENALRPSITFEDTDYYFPDHTNLGRPIHPTLMNAVNSYFGIPSASSNTYFTEFKTIGETGPSYFGDPLFADEVDIEEKIGENSNFVHKDCITETKLLNRPMAYVFKDPPYEFEYGWKYDKNDVIFYYNKAISWFQSIKPSSHVFLQCKMRAEILMSIDPYTEGLFGYGPYNYDCSYDYSPPYPTPHSGYLYKMTAMSNPFYGEYAKINYRIGPEPSSDELLGFPGSQPNKSYYSL